jgi:hypothetical protein
LLLTDDLSEEVDIDIEDHFHFIRDHKGLVLWNLQIRMALQEFGQRHERNDAVIDRVANWASELPKLQTPQLLLVKGGPFYESLLLLDVFL